MLQAAIAALTAANSPAANIAAIQAALDTGKPTCLPRGTWHVEARPDVLASLLMKAKGQQVFGHGELQTTLVINGGGNLFHTNGFHGCAFRDFGVIERATAPHTSGFVFVFDGVPGFGDSNLQQIGGLVRDVRIINCWNGAYVRDVNNLTFDRVTMAGMRGDFGYLAEAADQTQRIDLLRINHSTVGFVSAAPANGRGVGICINGYVHTIQVENTSIVAPLRGILVQNTPGLPFGQHAAFLLCNDVEVDQPRFETLHVSHIDRCSFSNSYFHGSKETNNIWLGPGVRDANFCQTNITGAWQNGLVFEGDDLDLIGCAMDWNSSEERGRHSGVVLGATAQRARVVGGGHRGSNVGYGIWRANPATSVLLAAADHHAGCFGLMN